MWRSLAATATLAVALTNPALVVAQEAPASQKSLAEQLIDAVFGVHPGMRANHPKGVVMEYVHPCHFGGSGEQGRSPAKEEGAGAGDGAVLCLKRR